MVLRPKRKQPFHTPPSISKMHVPAFLSQIHWSDLYVAELIDRLETTFNKKELVANYPKLLAHSKRVHEIPNIKKYVQTRPKTPL